MKIPQGDDLAQGNVPLFTVILILNERLASLRRYLFIVGFPLMALDKRSKLCRSGYCQGISIKCI